MVGIRFLLFFVFGVIGLFFSPMVQSAPIGSPDGLTRQQSRSTISHGISARTNDLQARGWKDNLRKLEQAAGKSSKTLEGNLKKIEDMANKGTKAAQDAANNLAQTLPKDFQNIADGLKGASVKKLQDLGRLNKDSYSKFEKIASLSAANLKPLMEGPPDKLEKFLEAVSIDDLDELSQTSGDIKNAIPRYESLLNDAMYQETREKKVHPATAKSLDEQATKLQGLFDNFYKIGKKITDQELKSGLIRRRQDSIVVTFEVPKDLDEVKLNAMFDRVDNLMNKFNNKLSDVKNELDWMTVGEVTGNLKKQYQKGQVLGEVNDGNGSTLLLDETDTADC
ncbi:hypothetical protein NUU61_007030 [Penicillium alfredii]|uniref:Domain of unknown function WSN domain-containing protein n=1 Tax=Penicillium alfredii TaxID=1506179 RepID=A0A9W9K464_9EURO|nr:uncharacterized protein NUU61_007030 [Penicillium alfredii]KAJ5092160.1 hypothetical protein NUU61_007030 [Penicillium alfredii]